MRTYNVERVNPLTLRQWKSLVRARKWRDEGVSQRRKVDRRWAELLKKEAAEGLQ